MTEERNFEVRSEDAGARLDVFVSSHLEHLSRTATRSLIDRGFVSINGSSSKASRRVEAGDKVSVLLEPRTDLNVEPEDIPLQVVYADEDMAVIDKPAGLVVHPAAGHSSGTLVNALAAMFPTTRGVGGAERPGLVHRLDKDTSGLMVVALSSRGYASLHGQIADRTAGRTYLALITGTPERDRADIDAPLGRDPADRRRMAVHGVAARSARTTYRVLEVFPGFALVEAKLHTGRTHQIRVHMAAIGHPVAGDVTYHGMSPPGLNRQFLHAHRLDLNCPSTGERLSFTSTLPPDLAPVLVTLRGEV